MGREKERAKSDVSGREERNDKAMALGAPSYVWSARREVSSDQHEGPVSSGIIGSPTCR